MDAPILVNVAKSLKVPMEAIKNFNDEATFNNVANSFQDNSYLINYQFNPIEKIIELYDVLLKSEKEKIALLEKLLGRK